MEVLRPPLQYVSILQQKVWYPPVYSHPPLVQGTLILNLLSINHTFTEQAKISLIIP